MNDHEWGKSYRDDGVSHPELRCGDEQSFISFWRLSNKDRVEYCPICGEKLEDGGENHS